MLLFQASDEMNNVTASLTNEDNAKNRHIYITANDNGKWFTGYCFNQRAYICQIPLHKSPQEIQNPPGRLAYMYHA